MFVTTFEIRQDSNYSRTLVFLDAVQGFPMASPDGLQIVGIFHSRRRDAAALRDRVERISGEMCIPAKNFECDQSVDAGKWASECAERSRLGRLSRS